MGCAAVGEVVTGPNLLFDYEDDLYEVSVTMNKPQQQQPDAVVTV